MVGMVVGIVISSRGSNNAASLEDEIPPNIGPGGNQLRATASPSPAPASSTPPPISLQPAAEYDCDLSEFVGGTITAT